MVEKERRYEEKLKQYEKEQAKIEQLEKAAEQLRIWAYSGHGQDLQAGPVHGEAHRADADHRPPQKERKMEVRFGEREFRGTRCSPSRAWPSPSEGAPCSPR